jgi:hypothetical protein
LLALTTERTGPGTIRVPRGPFAARRACLPVAILA